MNMNKYWNESCIYVKKNVEPFFRKRRKFWKGITDYGFSETKTRKFVIEQAIKGASYLALLADQDINDEYQEEKSYLKKLHSMVDE